MITEKSLHIRGWMWKQRFERTYSNVCGMVGNGQPLQLLLGVRGSGVDHLGRMVSQPGIAVRYFANPLTRVHPPLQLAAGSDPLAVPYARRLEGDHPLFRVYRMLVEHDKDWSVRYATNRIAAHERSETPPCLVKESHALLATEALLTETGAKALLYVSDPVRIVDALFGNDRLDTPYLVGEGKSVLTPPFLARFVKRDYARLMKTQRQMTNHHRVREQIILFRVLTVALIQHMFRMLAIKYPEQTALVDFATLSREPHRLKYFFESVFGEAGLGIARGVLAGSTFMAEGRETALWKNAWPEQGPGWHYLTIKDVEMCYAMLSDCGLGGTSPGHGALFNERRLS